MSRSTTVSKKLIADTEEAHIHQYRMPEPGERYLECEFCGEHAVFGREVTSIRQVDRYRSHYGAGRTRIVETFQSYAAQDAETWYWEYLRGLDVDQLRDPGLADRLLQDAKGDKIRVFGDFQDAIDEAIADREDADADDRTPRVTQGARLDAGAAPD